MHKTHYLEVTGELNGRKSACRDFLWSLSSEKLKLSDREGSLVVDHPRFTLEGMNVQRVLSRGHHEWEQS